VGLVKLPQQGRVQYLQSAMSWKIEVTLSDAVVILKRQLLVLEIYRLKVI